ncbi:MAG: helix-hairpin-helix domain-containing protein [Pseudomonadota bacterium]
MIRNLVAAAALALALANSPIQAAEVNINAAGPAELAANLVGIGAAKAAAIVDYRRSNGPFRSIDDLAKVDGIGKAIIDQNRAIITLGKPARPKSAKP